MGRVFLENYNLDTKKRIEKELFRIDKVIDLKYAPDGKKMVFSGVNQGQTDLYAYYVIGNSQERITNDIYDDLEPAFLNDGKTTIFSSNRPDDTLRKEVPLQLLPNEHDVFLIHSERKTLSRVTDTPGIDERQPAPYQKESYTFLSDENGLFNRYVAHIDSAISRIDTTIHYRFFTVSEPVSDFNTSILEYDYIFGNDRYYYTIRQGGRMQLQVGMVADDTKIDQDLLGGAMNGNNDSSSGKLETLTPVEEEELEIDFRNYVFEDERKDYEYEKESIRIDISPSISESSGADTLGSGATGFQLPKSGNYRVNFATDYVLSQIDNTFTNRFYQPFTSPTSMTPGISGLIKLGVSDLFEDYEIIGGFRLAGNLDDNY